jgi:hypothetical protein
VGDLFLGCDLRFGECEVQRLGAGGAVFEECEGMNPSGEASR